MKEPIAWKGRNKSQAVLHCSSCYLLWYGVVGHVRGDDEQPGLPAALCSQAGGACRASGLLFLPSLPPSFLPPPAAQTTSPPRVHLSFSVHDLKAAGGTVRALGLPKGQLELGHPPQAAVVMADVCAITRCKGLERCQEEASAQPGFGDGRGNSAMTF